MKSPKRLNNLDIVSIIGIALSIIAILGGQLLEGGHISSLLQVTAFIIVVGGTVGAIMLQSSMEVFLQGVNMVKWVFKPPQHAPDSLVKQIVAWSSIARRSGLLSLESNLEKLEDPFMRKGLQMLVDGAEPERLRETLEVEVGVYEEHHRQGAKVWESAGGYAPTIGILGAVMGLIHVMENLGDPSRLGAGIAVAFVATIYGVGLANLLFLPIANKLKAIIAQQVVIREMFIEGMVSIAIGENPRVIENKLYSYVLA